MSFFDELKTSLEEAVEIKQGLKEPARMTRYEIADAKAVVDRKRCSRRIRHSGAQCLMRRLPRLIRPGDSQRIEISWFIGRIRRSRRIRHFTHYFAIRLYLIRFGSSASAPSVRFLYSSYSVKLPSKNSTLPSSW
ncbi:lipid A biosynthesis protein [Escherichia coli]|uniref:Lipid A biosynthesis protein n=1 Tax=Escherichia coli TaxID=562 RepID=A0A377E3M8_ECOLX|nr:lipid A biosynthesis protein [Escherichia coli]